MSQESLYIDKSPNVREQNDRCGNQTISHDSSLTIRSSSSAHNILADVCSPTKQLRGSRPSAAGVWRTPLSQRPAPSTQPIRIDIPLTRATRTQTSPQTASTNQNLQVNRKVVAPTNPDHHIHACPKKPPQSSFPSQQQRSTSREEGSTPTKHVSFQDPPAQERHCPKNRTDPEQETDVWRRREARAQLEKLCEVELLEQEVQRLRLKEERTLEENHRLRRLSLEWQFQKRLQEIQKKGEEDEEEEEDEALDTSSMIQTLERQTQAGVTHITQNPSLKLFLILVFFCRW